MTPPFAKFTQAVTFLKGEVISDGKWTPYERTLYSYGAGGTNSLETILTSSFQQLVVETARADRRGLMVVMRVTSESIPIGSVGEGLLVYGSSVNDCFSGEGSETEPEIPADESRGDDVSTLEDSIKEMVEEAVKEALEEVDADQLLEKLIEADDWDSAVQNAADSGDLIERRVRGELDERTFIDMDDVRSEIRDHTDETEHGSGFDEDAANSWAQSALDSFPGEGSRCALGRAVASVIRQVLQDEETKDILVEMLLGSVDTTGMHVEGEPIDKVTLAVQLLAKHREMTDASPWISREVAIASRRFTQVLERAAGVRA